MTGSESPTSASKMPLVSVVVIFLNGEKFLREAIESVFAQTYPHWELLLVDGGSIDASTAMAREYAESKPDKIRHLEHAGHHSRGPSAARNLGIHNARGDFVAFLDCDDVWRPNKLEEQVAILLAHPEAGMVFGAVENCRSWTNAQTEGDTIPQGGVPANRVFHPPELLRLLHPLGQFTAPCPSDLLLRRDVFETAGLFQEEFRNIYDDQAFLVRAYLHTSVFVSGNTWIRHRTHPDSAMAKVEGTGAAIRPDFLSYVQHHLAAEGVRDAAIWKLLRKALREYGRSVARAGAPEVDVRELKWEIRTASASQAQLELPPEDPDLLRVSISKFTGQNVWDIQLNQARLAVCVDGRYRLDFLARALELPAEGRRISVGFAMAHEPWAGLGLYHTIELTQEWQDFSFEFTASASDENGRIHFDLGGSPVSLELASVAIYCLPDGRLLGQDCAVHGLYPEHRWESVSNRPAEASEADRGEADGSAAKPNDGEARPRAPRFSVVIPTYQRRELVLQAVRAFARQDFAGAFEVIVVVDGSRDGSAEALRALDMPFPLTVIEQPNQGAAAARNTGASSSRGEILLFLDDDMEAHPRMLSEHEHSYREGADVVLGHLPLHPKSPQGFMSAGVKLWAEERGRQLSQPGAELSLDDVLTGQISMKREIFQKASGFDTTFTAGGSFGNEDIDLGCRLLVSGCRLVFNLYAISYQSYVVTPRHYLRQMRDGGRADVVFARKHPERASAIFAVHRGRWLKPGTWRALTAFGLALAPLMNTVRAVVLAQVERPAPSSRAVQLFFELCEMEYWRGVRDAGGMPRFQTVRILAYHAIQDLAGQRLEAYGTPQRQFQRQMRMLQRVGFHFISPDQFLGFLRRGTPLPRWPLLLTFDDCYKDLVQFALPVLRRLKIPAVAFAVSGLLGRSNTWDQACGDTALQLLDQSGLLLLAKHGVEIGSHSRTHSDLTTVSPGALEEEIAGSIQELEAAGLNKARLFAYPYGAWNAAVCQVAKRTGLEAAFTVKPGVAFRGGDAYRIPRIQIMRSDTGWLFLRKVIEAA